MKKTLCLLLAIACITNLSAQDTAQVIHPHNDTTITQTIFFQPEYRQFRQSATGILNTLDGSSPGIQSTSTNTSPGSSPELLIRGVATSVSPSNPLIVLNGVPFYGDIMAINVQDVDSVSILR